MVLLYGSRSYIYHMKAPGDLTQFVCIPSLPYSIATPSPKPRGVRDPHLEGHKHHSFDIAQAAVGLRIQSYDGRQAYEGTRQPTPVIVI